MNKYSPLFALVGFGLVVGLGSLFSGCTSPAQAEQGHLVILDVQPVTVVTETLGSHEHYVTADGVTIDVEPATLTLFPSH